MGWKTGFWFPEDDIYLRHRVQAGSRALPAATQYTSYAVMPRRQQKIPTARLFVSSHLQFSITHPPPRQPQLTSVYNRELSLLTPSTSFKFKYEISNDALSLTNYTAWNRRVSRSHWAGRRSRRSQPSLRQYNGICLEGLKKKTMKALRIIVVRAEIWRRSVPNIQGLLPNRLRRCSASPEVIEGGFMRIPLQLKNDTDAATHQLQPRSIRRYPLSNKEL
jgi:hypothetical protein